jgi:hypothetical protein
MDAEACPWSRLMLLAQLPSKPSSPRVVLWRPCEPPTPPRGERHLNGTPHYRSRGLLRTITRMFRRLGPGACCESRTSYLESNESIVRLFQSDRSREYGEFAEPCAAFLNEIDQESAAEKYTFAEMVESEQDLKKVARWLGRSGRRTFLTGTQISQSPCNAG